MLPRRSQEVVGDPSEVLGCNSYDFLELPVTSWAFLGPPRTSSDFLGSRIFDFTVARALYSFV